MLKLVWLNRGAAQFAASLSLDSPGPVSGLGAADLTGDGLPDLVAYGPAGLQLFVQR